ncbi:MAG: cache domain-containing protein [Nitrospirae bacterium]|nr:cache domain-containing protein [Nitrospirota bacterium]
MKRRGVFWRVLLVVGVPILVILFTFGRELADIAVLDRQNPLNGVASTLLERVDRHIRDATELVDLMASAMAMAEVSAEPPLSDYGEYVRSGPFFALARVGPGAPRTWPDPPPDGLGAAWLGGPAVGVSKLFTLPDGRPALTIATPLGDGARGHLVALFDVARVLGAGEVERMRVARQGEAFVVDEGGRVILSANRHLLGRTLGELGLATPGPGGEQMDRWLAADGTPYLVGLARNPGWYQGPHHGWMVGLVAPEAQVLGRNLGMKRYLGAVMVAIVVISGALLLLLRRSVRGRR